LKLAGLLACDTIQSLPVYTVAKVVELLPSPFRAGASLYSYGDSAGFSPASLLIPPRQLPGLRTKFAANV